MRSVRSGEDQRVSVYIHMLHCAASGSEEEFPIADKSIVLHICMTFCDTRLPFAGESPVFICNGLDHPVLLDLRYSHLADPQEVQDRK